MKQRRMVEYTDREKNPVMIDLNDVAVVSYRNYLGQGEETIIVISSGYQITVVEGYQQVCKQVQGG